MADRFTFSGGVRMEAIPSSDLIGGDRGFRRPGMVTSVEPVVSYTTKKANFYFSVPVAVKRNRNTVTLTSYALQNLVLKYRVMLLLLISYQCRVSFRL